MQATPNDPKAGCLVFNIQKYSVHDGPGIRTVVFLKGCPLRCAWCSNPESQEPGVEIAYNAGRCLGLSACMRCVEVCTCGAISLDGDDRLAIARDRCGDCAHPCVQVCPSHALIPYGERRTVEEIVRIVEQDSQFYSRSGGGMTLSGGEPFYQASCALALLGEARRRHINTAAETCGHVRWEVLDSACRLLDTLLFDIKHADPQQHMQGTGVSNSLILENFHKVMDYFPDLSVQVRTPVIPGFNDTEAAINAILDILECYPQVDYQLLPYHRLGTQKYHFLGRTPAMGADLKLDDTRLAELQALVAQRRA